MAKKRSKKDDSESSFATSDPARIMELLWRVPRPAVRGPRPGLSVDKVVATAIRIADAEGLDAVSMRRVAEALGVGAMSLYTYVPGKAELLDLMYDAVLGEDPSTFDEGASWRARVEAMARRDLALYERHAWMLELPWARAPLGPHALEATERSLAAFAGSGLTGREMMNAISLVGMFVRGAAIGAVEARASIRRTGQTDAEWWEPRAALLEKYWSPARFPILTAIEKEGAFEPTTQDCDYFAAEARDTFEFGLRRICDGIDVLVRLRAAPPA
jgi:AcrR family transcriptional regulator